MSPCLDTGTSNGGLVSDMEPQVDSSDMVVYGVVVGSMAHILSVVVSLVYLAMVFLCSLLGNMLVVYVIVRHLRVTSLPNAFIASLSVSDLLATALCLPPTMASLVAGGWVLGNAPCLVTGVLQTTFAIVSTLMVTFVAMDRYVILGTAPRPPGLSRAFTLGGIVGVWGVAFVLAMPYQALVTGGGVLLAANQTGPFYHCVSVFHTAVHAQAHGVLRSAFRSCVVSVCFLLSFALMGFCCVQLLRLIQRGQTAIRPSSNGAAQLWLNTELRTGRTAILMVVLHIATRGPYVAMSVAALALGEPFSLVADTVGMWLFWASCIVNPVLYALRSPKFSEVLNLRRRIGLVYQVTELVAHVESGASTPTPTPENRLHGMTFVTGGELTAWDASTAATNNVTTPSFLHAPPVRSSRRSEILQVFTHFGIPRKNSAFSAARSMITTTNI